MKEAIDTYGRTILLVIVTIFMLTMFANLWFGSGAYIADIANRVFKASTSDMTTTSTSSGTMQIVKSDGTVINETQQGSALELEQIAKRDDAKLYAAGTQNGTDQIITGIWYNTSNLLWAVDADGNMISKSLSANTAVDNDGYYNGDAYFRVLSVSTGNGYELISNLSDIDTSSIAYSNMQYTNKTGAAGNMSSIAGQSFNICADDGSQWLSYNAGDQKWYFYKSGTYCMRVFVCDSKGKSTTGTVYVSVNKRLTDNSGSGNDSVNH